MAFFGYVKVPSAAVKLSFRVECFLEECVKHSTLENNKITLKHYYDIQKTLTDFLRSGRIINEKINSL
jgi:hypothetical protein